MTKKVGRAGVGGAPPEGVYTCTPGIVSMGTPGIYLWVHWYFEDTNACLRVL